VEPFGITGTGGKATFGEKTFPSAASKPWAQFPRWVRCFLGSFSGPDSNTIAAGHMPDCSEPRTKETPQSSRLNTFQKSSKSIPGMNFIGATSFYPRQVVIWNHSSVPEIFIGFSHH